jgi:hypothetical protein
MNIFNIIQNKKKEIVKYKDEQQQKKAIRTAQTLKELKARRQALEGREKIYKLEEKEKEKINKAQQNLRKRTPAYRVINAIKDNLKEKQKRNMKKGSNNFGNMSLGGDFAKNSGGQIGSFNVGKNFGLNKK